jgi:Domain of unknown function DUF29
MKRNSSKEPNDGLSRQMLGAAHKPADERSKLYDHDYYSWTAAQAQALRERKTSALDWGNLAEEVEDLGKAERHRLESHLEGLLMHLLKGPPAATPQPELPQLNRRASLSC